jgi:hypothetical protein
LKPSERSISSMLRAMALSSSINSTRMFLEPLSRPGLPAGRG